MHECPRNRAPESHFGRSISIPFFPKSIEPLPNIGTINGYGVAGEFYEASVGVSEDGGESECATAVGFVEGVTETIFQVLLPTGSMTEASSGLTPAFFTSSISRAVLETPLQWVTKSHDS